MRLHDKAVSAKLNAAVLAALAVGCGGSRTESDGQETAAQRGTAGEPRNIALEGDSRATQIAEIQRQNLRIGGFYFIPLELELESLDASGTFEEEIGCSLEEINYDTANALPVQFDRSRSQFIPPVPEGSLVLIKSDFGAGRQGITCVLLLTGNFVIYTYPKGLRGSNSGPSYTGFSGSIGVLLTPESEVFAYCPPPPF